MAARRAGRLGAVAVSALAAAPFAWLWVISVRGADDPVTLRVRLDMAIWLSLYGAPSMLSAHLVQ